MAELTKEQQDLYDAKMQKAKDQTTQAEDLQAQITVLSTLQHDVLVCRDENIRQANEIAQGQARTEPKTLETVTAEIQAAKVRIEPIKEVIGEPIK